MAEYRLVDVFTERPFSGNQLAVFVDGAAVPASCMQKIARELNLAETVFVLPPADKSCAFRFRIFTPQAELPFAGHPTIGTACVLAELGLVKMSAGEARFSAEEGIGPVSIVVKKSRDLFGARFDARVPEQGQIELGRSQAAAMLSVPEQAVCADARAFSAGMPFVFIELSTLESVRSARLNSALWEQLLSNSWAREVYVFSRSGPEIFARMFAPRLGIAEDPATGAAAAALAGILGESGPDGVSQWRISQGTEIGRPSSIFLETERRSAALSAVRVGGFTVSVGDGRMRIVVE